MKNLSRAFKLTTSKVPRVHLVISELQSGGQHRGTRPKWKGTTPEQDGKMPLRNIKVSSLTPSTENTLPNQQTHRQTRRDIGGDSKVENSMDLEVSHTRDTTLETNFDHHQLILCSQLGKWLYSYRPSCCYFASSGRKKTLPRTGRLSDLAIIKIHDMHIHIESYKIYHE